MPYPLSNVLLESLNENDRRRLLRYLKPVSLPVNTTLYLPDEVPQYVHFITSGLASIVASTDEGRTTEVGTVGREGAPEGVHLLGSARITTRCFMQIGGTGLRVEYATFQQLFGAEASVHKAILAYAQYQCVMLGQVAGCNRFHTVRARLARWLLMVQDRTGESDLKLTQQFLAEMIGSQRTSVSEVAGALQERGLIRYSRGSVRVLNRSGLETVACGCYQSTRRLLIDLYAIAGDTVFGETGG